MRNATILLAGLIGFSTVRAEDPGRFEFEEPHMGTKFRIVLHAKDRPTADAAAKEAFARVAELNRIMSDYLPDSELSKLCAKSAKTPAGPVTVSADLFTILARADEISRLSDGSFDVTVGPIIKLWRQARKDRRLPDPDVLKEALSRVGYRKMELDPKARTVSLTVAGDATRPRRHRQGSRRRRVPENHLQAWHHASLGRRQRGHRRQRRPPRQTGLESRHRPSSRFDNGNQARLAENAAISTSGDEVQFVEIAGTRYSHIADPKTGLGLTGRRRVTVIARRGIDADSLTKMASILPADKVLPVIDQIEGAATLIVVLTEKGRRHANQRDLTGGWRTSENDVRAGRG